MVAMSGNPEIGDRMKEIIGKLAETNGLKGVIYLVDLTTIINWGEGRRLGISKWFTWGDFEDVPKGYG